MTHFITAQDHVQLAIPAGGEDDADRFYVGVLGFEVVAKPELLARRGGRWYVSGPVHLHLGVEEDFRPARKAHPAWRVRNLTRLRDRLVETGFIPRESHEIPGVIRVHVDDPFGNRLELIDEETVSSSTTD
ncbi:MAG: glyoxalase [Acidimicrobiaceae bacterium]|nr:glyoxalase [Acidimicrobiaceae bacterium]